MAMTEKDLKKLGRAELLELLIAQAKETESLRTRLADAQKQLDDRRVLLKNAGSIAEASLQLNGVFEAAQAAAEDYLKNIQLRSARQEAISRQMEEETQAKVQHMLAEAERRCKAMENSTAKKCEEMTRKVRHETEVYWAQVSAKLNEYLRQHPDMHKLLSQDVLFANEHIKL